MPLIRIDAVAGRTPEQVTRLLDAAHRAMLSAFQVPERDRYQIYQEHAAEHFIVQDTGLGIPRTDQVIVVTVISRPRPARYLWTPAWVLCLTCNRVTFFY